MFIARVSENALPSVLSPQSVSYNICVLQAAKQSRLEKFEIPAKIKLLASPWTPESGLVTAALKLKRDVIKREFSEDLTKLYAS